MATEFVGIRKMGGGRDAEGHRTWNVVCRVRATAGTWIIGPAEVLATPGLPIPGQSWASYTGDTAEPLAWFLPESPVEMLPGESEGARCLYADVTFTASTKPPPSDKQRCQDTQIENPLLEPEKITVNYSNTTEEASFDNNHDPILTSSKERVRGPQVEFDVGRWAVQVTRNVWPLNLSVRAPLANTVNDAAMWGVPARCIRFVPGPMVRNLYGQCLYYWTITDNYEIWVTLDEDGNPESGWDRSVMDEGTKTFRGSWQDVTGTGCTIDVVTVDGNGGVTGVALGGSGGTGYPPDSTFGLSLTHPDNEDELASVVVSSDDSGVVVEVVRIYTAGAGYVIDQDLVTLGSLSGAPHWVINNAGGLPPDPQRSGNFDLYTDLQGNPIRAVLDGGGIPIVGFSRNAKADAGQILVRKYRSANLLVLNPPLIL